MALSCQRKIWKVLELKQTTKLGMCAWCARCTGQSLEKAFKNIHIYTYIYNEKYNFSVEIHIGLQENCGFFVI